MKRTSESAWSRRTVLTTSTIGPQVRLVQYFGVAKATTNGARSASASATELRYSSRSGTRDVDSSSSVAVARVGVFEAGAAAPMSGATVRSLTTTVPTAWIFRPPTGSASTQYVPGSRQLQVRDEDRLGVGGVAALDPDLLRAGRRLRERRLLEPSRDPDPRGRTRDDAALPVDDQEREPHAAGAEVGAPGRDRDVLAGRTPEGFERRRLPAPPSLRRSRRSLPQ